ncbi:hypothetical protein VM1G_08306 [Cytospora mali]|uniref:Glycosyltransferase family 8 protein n=1 Tax=Cytospora mali TaxID=578113 RepID=A0A194W8E8_CYTMA|nr:hypothetical protein VM1G_08306 [Valsa mali]
MGSRVVRIGLLALTTALLICYHPTILSWSIWDWKPEEPTLKVVEFNIPQNEQSEAKGPSADTKWPTLPAEAVDSDSTDSSSPGPILELTGSSPQGSGPDTSSGSSSTGFNEEKYEFQKDLLLYTPPAFDVAKLKQYKPHNDHGPGQFAFATYLSTRDNNVHDPYFLSAMQLVYRVLWDPKSRSPFHPIVVFVAPFIPQDQRDLLQAAGAIVRELELVPWEPPRGAGAAAAGGDGDGDGDGVSDTFPFARWRDLFSKLNIWGQLDFSRIAFLDLDAFPVKNVDGIFDDSVAPRQRCRAELLPPEDKLYEREICDYIFAGHGLQDGVNVGVMILEPNQYMHQRLLRESQDTSKFDNKMAEQAFLNHAFRKDGPFPPNFIGREWNGFYPKSGEENLLRIVHEKLWIFGDNTEWTKDIFRNGWFELLSLYQSSQFELMRAEDGLTEQPSSGWPWIG